MKNMGWILLLVMIPSAALAQHSPDILGYTDKTLFGDLHLGKVHGNIGEATVGGEFGNDSVYSILLELDGRDFTEYDVYSLGGDLYWVIGNFLEPRSEICVHLPPGKKLKSCGSRKATINGNPYDHSLIPIPPTVEDFGDGFGPDDEKGFYVRLDWGIWEAGATIPGTFDFLFEMIASEEILIPDRADEPELRSAMTEPGHPWEVLEP